jgi:tRNA A37 threonylcarbamoyladenosine dehydratase
LNGYFDRQVRIHDWDQKLLEKQVAFIMGIGGLGSVVMMSLLRLGVKKIIIVDYDVVDNHNMNRQLMFSVKDIGKKKVDCAIINAEFHNVGNTVI